MVTANGKKNYRWLGLCALMLALVIWEIASVIVVIVFNSSYLLPSPADVVLAFADPVMDRLLLDFEESMVRFALGLGAALLVGIPIGIMMGWSRKFDAFLDPIVEILRPIPPLAWIPFAILWFGLTAYSSGFVIFMGAVFPIIINTYSGFRSVPKIYVEAGRVLGCTKNLSLVRYVAFPSALPSIVAGIRIATGVGWMCLVAAELFGASNGLGQALWFYYSLSRMDCVVVYMLLLGFTGLLIDMGFRYSMDRYFLRWQTKEVA